MSDTPLNLSPMESALLESLQRSEQEHDKRLTELERLLSELGTQSQTDSEQAVNAFRTLSNTLAGLTSQLAALDKGLQTLTVRVDVYRSEAQSMKESFEKAVVAFNSMASELGEIKRCAK